MSLQLTETLKRLRPEWKREALARGKTDGRELIFVNEYGRHLDLNNFRRRVWNKALKKAGLPHFRIHDLRHIYATMRIAKGDHIGDVSKQLGHHSVKLTLDIYYHWLPGQAKGQVDELDSPGFEPHLFTPYMHPAKKKGQPLTANPL